MLAPHEGKAAVDGPSALFRATVILAFDTA
jgi:hypothetical protein